jgi:large subunit ribosomal protein L6
VSRIGNKPIALPKGVELQVAGGDVICKGPKGELRQAMIDGIGVDVADGVVTVSRSNDQRRQRAFHGMVRALLQNMVTGVSEGFTRKLQIVGTGYRAEVEGSTLVLNLGFSHPLRYDIPTGISIEVDRNNNMTVAGIDKSLVGEVAARIRRYRPPDPYKGKGVRYADEQIKLKPGKTAASSAA